MTTATTLRNEAGKIDKKLKRCLDSRSTEDLVLIIDGNPHHVTFLPNFGAHSTTAGYNSIPPEKWLKEGSFPELAQAILEEEVIWKKIHEAERMSRNIG